MTHLSKGLIIQSLIGIAIYVIKNIQGNSTLGIIHTNKILFNFITIQDCIIMGNCVIVMLWSKFINYKASIFIKVWLDREQYNTFVWGMDNIESNTPYRKEFDYDKKDEFIAKSHSKTC